MTAAQISKGCDFPPRFVYRVLRRLVDAGLMTGVSGPGGGYSLARAPSKITVLDILLAVEGESNSARLEPVSGKHRKAVKLINDVSRRNEERHARDLRGITLSKLVNL